MLRNDPEGESLMVVDLLSACTSRPTVTSGWLRNACRSGLGSNPSGRHFSYETPLAAAGKRSGEKLRNTWPTV